MLSFDDLLIPIFEQIFNLNKQNQRLKEARDILLPRLMTGKITVD
jgi:type I restriction enzyme S subunit